VTTQGPIYGREAIEKHYAGVFQKVHFSNHVAKPDQYSPHITGTAGNEMWWNGEWNVTLQGQSGGPKQAKAIGRRLLFVRVIFGRSGCRSLSWPKHRTRRRPRQPPRAMNNILTRAVTAITKVAGAVG
jgi:hypothetical protein